MCTYDSDVAFVGHWPGEVDLSYPQNQREYDDEGKYGHDGLCWKGRECGIMSFFPR
jgi:hypothetical protein